MMRDGHDVAWAMDALIANAKKHGRGFTWARTRRMPVLRDEKRIVRVKATRLTCTIGMKP